MRQEYTTIHDKPAAAIFDMSRVVPRDATSEIKDVNRQIMETELKLAGLKLRLSILKMGNK